jgi:hypothetical protein
MAVVVIVVAITAVVVIIVVVIITAAIIIVVVGGWADGRMDVDGRLDGRTDCGRLRRCCLSSREHRSVGGIVIKGRRTSTCPRGSTASLSQAWMHDPNPRRIIHRAHLSSPPERLHLMLPEQTRRMSLVGA